MYQQLYRKKLRKRSDSNACCFGRPHKNSHLSSRHMGVDTRGLEAGRQGRGEGTPPAAAAAAIYYYSVITPKAYSSDRWWGSELPPSTPSPQHQKDNRQSQKNNERHQSPRTLLSIGIVCKFPVALRGGGNFTVFSHPTHVRLPPKQGHNASTTVTQWYQR